MLLQDVFLSDITRVLSGKNYLALRGKNSPSQLGTIYNAKKKQQFEVRHSITKQGITRAWLIRQSEALKGSGLYA